jgi:transcriptional regulator with XRE-family HTH domain
MMRTDLSGASSVTSMTITSPLLSPYTVTKGTGATRPLTTWIDVPPQSSSATVISVVELNQGSGEPAAFVLQRAHSLASAHSCEALARRPEWIDREYREAYAEAAVEQTTAWQIRANRKARGWTQEEFAQKLGTQQSAVSRLEDPSYGKHSLEMLVAVSNVFDCALSVRFIPYSVLALESADLSEESMVVKPFQTELFELEQTHGKEYAGTGPYFIGGME